jgi:hypothetical protein
MRRMTPRRQQFLFSARQNAMCGLPHMAQALVEEATLHKVASYARAQKRAAELAVIASQPSDHPSNFLGDFT